MNTINSWNWKYIEKNEYPKKKGIYLVSCIAEEWEITKGFRPPTYTEYACYDVESKCFHNDNGYNYNVYAWVKTVEPAETLYNKDWRDFFIKEENTCDIVRKYCEKNKLEIGNIDILDDEFYSDYARIEIFCTLPEEGKIDDLIDLWEE